MYLPFTSVLDLKRKIMPLLAYTENSLQPHASISQSESNSILCNLRPSILRLVCILRLTIIDTMLMFWKCTSLHFKTFNLRPISFLTEWVVLKCTEHCNLFTSWLLEEKSTCYCDITCTSPYLLTGKYSFIAAVDCDNLTHGQRKWATYWSQVITGTPKPIGLCVSETASNKIIYKHWMFKCQVGSVTHQCQQLYRSPPLIRTPLLPKNLF